MKLLLSTGRLDLLPGSPLQLFLEATRHLTPEERADRLENDSEIVRVHDEAAREGQTAAPNLDDQVVNCGKWLRCCQQMLCQVDHHFVALVEVEGALWELDGRRRAGAKLVDGIFHF